MVEKLPKSDSAGAEWLEQATRLKGVVLDRLEAMPEGQRNLASGSGDWSAAGVVEHLILVEENLVGLWKQKLMGIASPKAGMKSSLLSGMATFVMGKTQMRVPTVPELEPKGDIGHAALKERWGEAREQLIASLPADTGGAWILHPAFGPLSSDQMGKLLAAHLEHHLRHWPTPKV